MHAHWHRTQDNMQYAPRVSHFSAFHLGIIWFISMGGLFKYTVIDNSQLYAGKDPMGVEEF